MKLKTWGIKGRLYAATVLLFALSCSRGVAQGNGYGHDKHGDHDEHGRDYRHEHDRGRSHDRDHYDYSNHDRVVMRGWYREHERHLPPGLARRDHLPPGLERQLVVRSTLPPGLRVRIHPCPQELLRELPPPPPDYENVVIGGHIVLLNRRNFMVMSVFHFEL